jgi:homeobox protein cut-like
MITPPGHHSIGSLSSSDLKKSQQNQQSSHPNLHPSHHHHQQQSSALRALQQHMTPSVYEMAALTQDLDTQIITTKIKEALLANNIGQKVSTIASLKLELNQMYVYCSNVVLHACHSGLLS